MPSTHTRRRALTALCTALAIAAGPLACDGLAGSDFRGESMFAFDGEVTTFDTTGNSELPYRVSVFWSSTEGFPLESALHEQGSLAVEVTFPAAFTIDIFHPPAESLLVPPQARYAVGVVLAYQDRDGDGQLTFGSTPPELAGGAENQAVLYLPAALDASESPTRGALPAGFHLATLPLACHGTDDSRLVLPGAEDCGVDLGAACTDSSECGAGECRTEIGGEEFPGGYCTLRGSDSCTPAGSSRVEFFSFDRDTGDEALETWHLRACTGDDDCASRSDDGYYCDHFFGACMPDLPVAIVLASDLHVAPVCADFGYFF